MQEMQKMQYLNSENFILRDENQILGELHKVAGKRQMFLRQNHTLRIAEKLHKIMV